MKKSFFSVDLKVYHILKTFFDWPNGLQIKTGQTQGLTDRYAC